jgi:hypothetical protein
VLGFLVAIQVNFFRLRKKPLLGLFVPLHSIKLVRQARSAQHYTTGGAEPEALRIRLVDHKVETITSLKDLRRVADWEDNNTQVSVAPNGSAVFTRDTGTQEIYALTVKWP